MNFALFNIYESLNSDEAMFCNDTAIGDDLCKPLVDLKRSALHRGIECSAYNSTDPEKIDRLLFLDLPRPTNRALRFAKSRRVPADLVLFECGLIRPSNWQLSRHRGFERVFTWNDDLVDNRTYFKINFSFDLKTEHRGLPFAQRKLCHLINSNKAKGGKGELYSERIKTIRWFERHAPEDFSLYGFGWDRLILHGRWSALNPVVRRLKIKRKNQFPSYVGPVRRKRDVLGQYKFGICYENCRYEPGYITEKIFDCFFNGCVPIYWGPENIEDHIPADCFVNRLRFRDHSEMLDFMKEFKEEDYEKHRKSVRDFLDSPKARPFSIEYFTETLLSF